MIRNLLLVSGSGMVLFTKEFVVSQKRMMGALLIAMRELSRKVSPVPSFVVSRLWRSLWLTRPAHHPHR